jgi:hypothetical protein
MSEHIVVKVGTRYFVAEPDGLAIVSDPFWSERAAMVHADLCDESADHYHLMPVGRATRHPMFYSNGTRKMPRNAVRV